MTLSDGEGFFGIGQGCPEHGDDAMVECSMCGVEYCRRCHPGVRVCPSCTSDADEEDLADEADFDDVDELDELLDGKDDLLVPDADETPPP